MAASPSELHPRGAIAIVDSSVRLCARSADLWSLALPGGALVAAGATFLAEALRTGQNVLLACAVMTAAWFLRSLFQGAAAHFAEKQLVETTPPTVRGSLRLALAHLPTLFITTAVVLFVNVISLTFTLGFSVLFLSAHIAAYAVAMKDAGHPLGIIGTSSRVLGPARAHTPGVRIALWSVVLVALNLHIASNFLILLGRKLLGLNLTFLDRYASLDNPVWDVAVITVAFALTEPLRAAVAALLVVDGRVRQDGVDLQSAIEQLPRRRPRATVTAAGTALLVLATSLLSFNASAGPEPKGSASNRELGARFQTIVNLCADGDDPLTEQVEQIQLLRSRENAALSRFLAEVESLVNDDDDCEAAVQRLEAGLPLVAEVGDALAEGTHPDPGEKAKEILGRPEFLEAPKAVPVAKQPEPEEPQAQESWWSQFWSWFSKLLKEWFEREPVVRERPSSISSSGSTFAWLLAIVLGVGVIGVVLWLVLRTTGEKSSDLENLEIVAATSVGATVSAGALARAPQGWSELADALAAKGDYREAIRHLYLAVLSKLHGLGAIDYDPGLSNWDYLRKFKGREAWKTDFRELTFRFDYAFYGKESVSPEAYAKFRAGSARILEADPNRQEAAHA